MAVGRRQVHAVYLLELLDGGQSCLVESKLALEGMQDDAFEQIARMMRLEP